MVEHTLRSYDVELTELSSEVSRMGALAVSGIADAMTALVDGDARLAEEVAGRDRTLDQMESAIEDHAVRMMALLQPVAVDLRQTVAGMKMASNLERVGDLAKNIAKRALVVAETELPSALMPPIERMGRLVLSRLKSALQAYAETDLTRAHEVWTLDREVDETYESVFRELLTYMMGDPRLIAAGAHLLFIAKNLERVGDHATNIAEVVHYAATGEQLVSRPKSKARQP